METQPAAQAPWVAYHCPRCDSPETETVKRRVGAFEKLTVLLIPLFLVIGAVFGYLLFIFGLALLDVSNLGSELELIGCCASFMLILPAGGVVLATLLGRAFIRRRRRRLHLSQTTCRCKMCGTVFIPELKQ